MTVRRPSRLAALALACIAGAVLAACSSAPTHFYTLSPLPATPAPTGSASTAASASAWLIELAPVDVPPQVAKNQFVVQTDANRVDVLEQERWSSLPGDEIRRALSGDLTQRLGTIDVYGTAYPQGVPVYRVSVNVQRFESWPASHTLLDAVWSVHALKTQTVLTCRSVLTEPAGAGYDQLVDGHRRAVAELSGAIAAGVRELAARPHAAANTPASAQTGGRTAAQPAAPAALPCPQATADATAMSGAPVQ